MESGGRHETGSGGWRGTEMYSSKRCDEMAAALGSCEVKSLASGWVQADYLIKPPHGYLGIKVNRSMMFKLPFWSFNTFGCTLGFDTFGSFFS